MKTTLKQQRDLTRAITAETGPAAKIMLLRRFLRDNGYEELHQCKHITLERVTGKCTSCGRLIGKPITYDSDEQLEALRAKLMGDLTLD